MNKQYSSSNKSNQITKPQNNTESNRTDDEKKYFSIMNVSKRKITTSSNRKIENNEKSVDTVKVEAEEEDVVLQNENEESKKIDDLIEKLIQTNKENDDNYLYDEYDYYGNIDERDCVNNVNKVNNHVEPEVKEKNIETNQNKSYSKRNFDLSSNKNTLSKQVTLSKNKNNNENSQNHSQIHNHYNQYNIQELTYEIVKEYSHLKPDKNIDFLKRMIFDIVKRQTKDSRVNTLLEVNKRKIDESQRILTFNRLIEDANRRIEAMERMDDLKCKLNEGKNFNIKKYSQEDWNFIYETRFKGYIEDRVKQIKDLMEVKEKMEILTEEKEMEIIKNQKKVRLSKEEIDNSVKRMYMEAERRKLKERMSLNKENNGGSSKMNIKLSYVNISDVSLVDLKRQINENEKKSEDKKAMDYKPKKRKERNYNFIQSEDEVGSDNEQKNKLMEVKKSSEVNDRIRRNKLLSVSKSKSKEKSKPKSKLKNRIVLDKIHEINYDAYYDNIYEEDKHQLSIPKPIKTKKDMNRIRNVVYDMRNENIKKERSMSRSKGKSYIISDFESNKLVNNLFDQLNLK